MFVKFFHHHTSKLLTLLVDTGADISLIKIDNVSQSNHVNLKEITTLSGIGEGIE